MKAALLLASALVAVGLTPAAEAAGGSPAKKPKPYFSYFLPRTTFAAQVKLTLQQCPAGAEPIVASEWTLEGGSEPDPAYEVKVDLSRGFLADRSTALVLRPDGTLESFNASRTGQAGAVLQSALKFATVVAPMLGATSPVSLEQSQQSRRLPRCSTDAANLVAALAATSAQIEALEAKVLLGTVTPVEVDILDRLRARRVSQRGKLTRTWALETQPDGEGIFALQEQEPKSRWFENPADEHYKFVVTLQRVFQGAETNPNDGSVACSQPGVKCDGLTDPRPRLVYRRPVPALFSGVAQYKESGPLQTEASAIVPVAQWSGLYSVSVGSAGLFGKREVKAKFDPFGAPLELSYGSESGAADIASTIDTGTEAATTLRDRELDNLERQIKLEEARQKLRELRAKPSAE